MLGQIWQRSGSGSVLIRQPWLESWITLGCNFGIGRGLHFLSALVFRNGFVLLHALLFILSLLVMIAARQLCLLLNLRKWKYWRYKRTRNSAVQDTVSKPVRTLLSGSTGRTNGPSCILLVSDSQKAILAFLWSSHTWPWLLTFQAPNCKWDS